MTQTTTSRIPKHEGHDRTGDWTTRVKMSQDLEQAINDGLYYYEEDLWGDDGQRVSYINEIYSIYQPIRYEKISKTLELVLNLYMMNVFYFVFFSRQKRLC